jgi:hypothetical protein
VAIRIWLALPLAGVIFLAHLVSGPAPACCPAPPKGKPVVNADQTVLMIWDAATKTQHFIRQASFKSEADDFGFLVPTPSQPELDEAGNETFRFLLKLTEPEKKKVPRGSAGSGCSCGSPPPAGLSKSEVRVLEEKLVAGLHAVVLESISTTALVNWLKEHGYAFSPAVEAWAKPYVEGGWKITALKVAKSKDEKEKKDVAATALRMSFKTERPLFPYREPEAKEFVEGLGAKHRLLRIYFVAEARYQGGADPGGSLDGPRRLVRQAEPGRPAGSVAVTETPRDDRTSGVVADGIRGRLALQSGTGRRVFFPRPYAGRRQARADH